MFSLKLGGGVVEVGSEEANLIKQAPNSTPPFQNKLKFIFKGLAWILLTFMSNLERM